MSEGRVNFQVCDSLSCGGSFGPGTTQGTQYCSNGFHSLDGRLLRNANAAGSPSPQVYNYKGSLACARSLFALDLVIWCDAESSLTFLSWWKADCSHNSAHSGGSGPVPVARSARGLPANGAHPVHLKLELGSWEVYRHDTTYLMIAGLFAKVRKRPTPSDVNTAPALF